MGHEVLGAVVEVGKGVKKFQKGDLVVSPFSASCGTPLLHSCTLSHSTDRVESSTLYTLYHTRILSVSCNS
jgi:threonine dehydrogenase-like Zn-dependent dehydrogenase